VLLMSDLYVQQTGLFGRFAEHPSQT
jgi:hypothetical protein